MAVHPPGIEDIGQAHRVIDRRQINATIMLAHQNMTVIFQIMPDLQHRLILEQRLQDRHGIIERNLLRQHGIGFKVKTPLPVGGHGRGAMAERHIAGLPGCQRHRNADKLRRLCIQRTCLGINRQIALAPCHRDPVFKNAFFGDQLIIHLAFRHRRRRL